MVAEVSGAVLTTYDGPSPPELCHARALRHTCATELLGTGATIAAVRTFLGNPSFKTTSIYLASDEQRQDDIVVRRERGAATLDDIRDAA